MPTPECMVGSAFALPPPAKSAQQGRIRAELGQTLDRFLGLFNTNVGIHGTDESGKTIWKYVSGGPRNRSIQLGPLEIEAAFETGLYQRSPRFIGLRFGKVTRYGLIDIDADSPHHDAQTLQRLMDVADQHELMLFPCQSSFSGGWHLYLISDVAIPSVEMSRALHGLAKAAGIDTIAKGACEVYPDHNNLFQAVRLPGQAGFGFLDSMTGDVDDVFDASTPAANIRRILWLFDHRSNELEIIRKAAEKFSAGIPTTQAKRRGRPPKQQKGRKVISLRPGRLPAIEELNLNRALVRGYDKHSPSRNRRLFFDPINPYGFNQFQKGKRLYAAGLQAQGTRHGALMAVGYFLFFCGVTEDDTRMVILENWLRVKNNGMSKDLIDNPQAVRDEIKRMVKWKPTEEEDGNNGTPVLDFLQLRNLRIKELNRKKIIRAHDEVLAEGKKPTYEELQRRTKLSRQTISNHKKELGESWGKPMNQTENSPKPLPRVIGVDDPPRSKQASALEPIKNSAAGPAGERVEGERVPKLSFIDLPEVRRRTCAGKNVELEEVMQRSSRDVITAEGLDGAPLRKAVG